MPDVVASPDDTGHDAVIELVSAPDRSPVPTAVVVLTADPVETVLASGVPDADDAAVSVASPDASPGDAQSPDSRHDAV